MSFVIISGERYALDLGDTVLGGSGEGALDAREIAHLPPVALVSFPVDGPTTVRSLGAMPITINGAPLGDAAHRLRHGDRLEVGGLGIAYGDIRKAGRTSHVATVNRAAARAEVLQAAQSSPTACSGGRLTRLADRATFAVPDGGLTLGRDPDSHVMLTSNGVSRAHARIAAGLLGYTLQDLSVNGVWINGERVEGTHRLGQGDVLRIGQEEFRFDADEASFEPARQAAEEPVTAASHVAPPPKREAPARLLATLEVLSEGPLKGERFRVHRPTSQLGRGAHNEIRFDNDSVSGTHASLVQQGNRWMILDLGSRNGTFVDGDRVREPRELPSACEIQLGMLKLLFRAINAGEQGNSSTISVIGMS